MINNGNKRLVNGHIRTRNSKKVGVYYDVIIELGYDEVTGKRLQEYTRVNGTREDAEAVLLQKKAEYAAGDFLMPDKRLFKSYVDEFMVIYAGFLSESSKKDYKCMASYLIDCFGNVKLQDLTTIKIQTAYAQLLKKSTKSNKPLSIGTVKHLQRSLKCMLNYD